MFSPDKYIFCDPINILLHKESIKLKHTNPTFITIKNNNSFLFKKSTFNSVFKTQMRAKIINDNIATKKIACYYIFFYLTIIF